MRTIKEFIKDEQIRKEFFEDLRSLVQIPSVAGAPDGEYPYGKECAKAVDKAIEIANRFGLKTENHDYHCASAIYGDSEREVGIIVHLDVVPACNGWDYTPYDLTCKDGLLIGRGSIDDKGPFMTALYAVRYLKENNIKLPFSIRIIMGSDEEVGSSDMEYFKKVRNIPYFSFTPDAEFPVCIGEKGIMALKVRLGKVDPSITELSAGTVRNAVAGEARTVINGKEYKVFGVSTHASAPENSINAIGLLVDTLTENNAIAKEDFAKFAFLKKAAETYKGEALGIQCEDNYFGYLTCISSVLELKNGVAYQQFDIRYPMSADYERLLAKAEETLSQYGMAVESSSASKGYFKSPDSKEIQSLTKACEEVLGYECKPFTMGGGTYARSMPGAVAFGGRVMEYAGKLGVGKGGCHDRDEYMAVAEAEKSVEIIIRSMLNLGNIQV